MRPPLLTAGADHLKDELAEVERALARLLQSEIPAVADLGRYLLESGGKRFRPALTLLFYKLLGEHGPRTAAVELAAVVEMVHLATLAHDDVIDQAASRRGHESLWKRSGNRSAILEGDFIFSRAFRLLNSHPYEIRELVIDAVEQVLEGELLQESLRGRLPTPEEYERVIERKTASLIGAACTIGALVGDPDLAAEGRDAIRRAGRLLGTAYQMIDDLLDVFGTEALGKPRWTDQRGGWLTWPYIELVRRTEGSEVRELLERGPVEEEQRKFLLREMEKHGVRERFTERAQAAVAEAKELLGWLANSELKELLFQGFDFVILRER
jgi:octaprenyl-diphosphate synthase